MEVWDAYNKEFEKIEGMTLIRGEAIPDGVYHLVSDVIVRHADGTYLLMQRDSRKHFGGMWEATAGGSALTREGPLACAIRELREETGIESEALTEVGRVVNDHNHTLYVEFLCVTDCEKEQVTLQEGETSAFRWVTKDELVSMKKDELVTERMQRFIGELRPSNKVILIAATEDDLQTLWKMQVRAFSDILEKYQDYEMSPAAETFDKVMARYRQPWTTYYFIVAEDEVVGAIRVVDKKDGSRKRISPIWIMQEYRNKGYAQSAITAVEQIYGSENWCLDTILQEKGNLHLYEKMGYHQTGKIEKINDLMDIVFYEKD
jgi:8-oxo-dGTP pyrophosphatase MutT (NUDIX family)/GNAT superfamily N-acetyltransferase